MSLQSGATFECLERQAIHHLADREAGGRDVEHGEVSIDA
jgi:hypothetical protein